MICWKIRSFCDITARVSAAELLQMELPFSQADKVQMLVDSNRHLEEPEEQDKATAEKRKCL